MSNLPFDYCCGCSACAQKCPNNSISMKRDNEGFLKPVINGKTCLNCHLCEMTCPCISERKGYECIEAYGCTIKDTIPLSKSTSGGIFYVLADYVLNNGGIVYGASYDDVSHVFHERITDSTRLYRLQKSKYAQSDLRDTFKNVQRDLKERRVVLFSGTPCQIAGLQCFLGIEYANLILVQVFCAEVVSPLAWERYVDYLNDEYDICAIEVDTRCKLVQKNTIDKFSLDWKKPFIRITTEEHELLDLIREKDWFTRAFAEHLISRKSCSVCDFKFSGKKIYADISIGDFWGCENNAPVCFNHAGVSAVLIHTSKGHQAFQNVSKAIDYQRVEPDSIFKGNPGIMKPHTANSKREECLSLLNQGKMRFDDVIIKSLELNSELVKRSDKFGLFGSYNTRAALGLLCGKSNCSLLYQISNISLISLFSEPIRIPEQTILPRNPYRAEMLIEDFSKSIFKSDNQMKDVDILFIDFLEERFDIVKLTNSFLTYSDAMHDSNYKPEFVISRLSDESKSIWFKNCEKFIELLSRYSNTRLCLIESYLSSHYENEDGSMSEFDCPGFPIEHINDMLFKCYEYFKSYMKDVTVITQPKEMRYCENKHKHGIYPWHSNQVYYKYLSNEIEKFIVENAKNG